MTDLRLRAELWLAQVGPWPLFLTCGAVIAAAVWALILPAQERELALARKLAVAAATPASAARPVAFAGQPDSDSLQVFERSLATDADATRLMQRIWSDAARCGVRLSKVDYRTERDVAGGYSRLHITMPLGATYPGMRNFVFGLMAAFPTLSLDKLDMKRESASQPDIEATVHMTLLVHT
jgi:hypothetical protein